MCIRDRVVTIFHLLHKGNKMKLPDARRPNEIGRTNDPKYCLYHRMIHHPTDKCYVLKDRIQALVDAGVLTLKTEQKKVTANMVTLEFGKAPKVTVPDGTYSVPAPRLEVKHPPATAQNNKGLVPLTLEKGKSSGYTQTSSKTYSRIQRSPSQRASLAMSSPSCQTTTI